MNFSELGLAEPIVRAVATEGYSNPTPIQLQAIPPALAGRDVLGSAQTGTGKTGAFALPILHRLAASMPQANESHRSGGKRSRHRGRGGRGDSGAGGRLPRALVLCPTRELATQIFQSFGTYGKHLPVRAAVVFGGVRQTAQVRQLRAGVDVLVATPGRLLDLIEQGYIDLSAIETLVLDEVDRMLDMGFIRDIHRIIECMPNQRQTLLFSATMPAEIRRLADALLRDPAVVQTSPAATTVDAIAQSVYMVTRQNKPELLGRLLRHDSVGRALVFTRTKYGADKLVRVLERSGIYAGAIHGNKTQNARTRALNDFKTGRTPILIATDVASRGIDVDEITHVFNFDIPNEPESYVHRIGRTARAGATGIAIAFCDHEEIKHLRAIEQLTDIKLDVATDEQDLVFIAPANDHRRTPGGRGAPRQRSGGASQWGPKASQNQDRSQSKRSKRSRRQRRARAAA